MLLVKSVVGFNQKILSLSLFEHFEPLNMCTFWYNEYLSVSKQHKTLDFIGENPQLNCDWIHLHPHMTTYFKNITNFFFDTNSYALTSYLTLNHRNTQFTLFFLHKTYFILSQNTKKIMDETRFCIWCWFCQYARHHNS